MIVFYYLLCVSEYTSHRHKDHSCTQQFRECDMTFYTADHTIIPNTSNLSTLSAATQATMPISNPKNCAPCSIISHDTSNTITCPI